MSWTDERIDRLKEIWSQGITASQIADELGGVSRNAVIGKAHRLGLQSRPSPVKPNEEHEGAPRRGRARARAPRSAAPRPQQPRRAPAAGPPRAAAAAATRRRPRQPAEPPQPHDPFDRPGRLRPPGARASSSRRSRRRRRAAWSRPSRAPRSPTRPACSISTRRSANGRSAIPASPISTSAANRPIPAFLIASSIAESPTRRRSRAATAVRRRPCPSAAPASADTPDQRVFQERGPAAVRYAGSVTNMDNAA